MRFPTINHITSHVFQTRKCIYLYNTSYTHRVLWPLKLSHTDDLHVVKGVLIIAFWIGMEIHLRRQECRWNSESWIQIHLYTRSSKRNLSLIFGICSVETVSKGRSNVNKSIHFRRGNCLLSSFMVSDLISQNCFKMLSMGQIG